MSIQNNHAYQPEESSEMVDQRHESHGTGIEFTSSMIVREANCQSNSQNNNHNRVRDRLSSHSSLQEKEEQKLKALRDVIAQCRSSVNRRPSAGEIRERLQQFL
jgi:hypothetical protein